MEKGGAEALSCNKIDMFFSLFPQAITWQLTTIPASLTSLLFNPGLSWTSPHWRCTFQATLSEVSQRQQPAPMPAARGSSYTSATPTNPRLPEHCVTIHHPPGSIRAPRVIDSVQPSEGCLSVADPRVGQAHPITFCRILILFIGQC